MRKQYSRDVEMYIGTWIHRMRHEHQVDLRSITAKTGLDIGTISRIENLRTQATVETLVRFSAGLNITVNDFLEDWQGKPFALLSEPSFTTLFIPTLPDIEVLTTQVAQNSSPLMLWIANALNAIASQQGYVGTLFEPPVVEKLFFGPVWYRYELDYPGRLLPADILGILQQNGVLIWPDLIAYLQGMVQKRTITQLMPSSWLETLLHRDNCGDVAAVERVKTIDVLLLDQALQQDGKVIMLFWNVCSFHLYLKHLQVHVLPRSGTHEAIVAEQTRRFIMQFLIICRWLQQEAASGAAWRDGLWMSLQQRFALT